MKDVVTNKDLFTEILKIHEKIDDVVEKRITPLELWRAEIMGKLTLLTAFLSVSISLAFAWVKEKVLKV